MEKLLTDWHMVSIDFVGSNKFPMSSNGGGSESKAFRLLVYHWSCWNDGWSRSSLSLLIECNFVIGTWTVISGSEFDGPKIWMKKA